MDKFLALKVNSFLRNSLLLRKCPLDDESGWFLRAELARFYTARFFRCRAPTDRDVDRSGQIGPKRIHIVLSRQ